MSGLIHISWAGPIQIIVDENGKEWFFEMHNYCGPILLKKNGDPRERQPSEKSIFWEIVSQWAQQGNKVVDGYCVYDRAKPLNQ